MILIISTCLDKLSEFEFVKPIEDIVKKSNTKFFTKRYDKVNSNDLKKASKVIICGTALQDFGYLDKMEKFEWLKEFDKPVLGICAGMQIVAEVFGNKLIDQTKIGKFKVIVVKKNKLTKEKSFDSYFLHTKTAKIMKNFDILAKSDNSACIIKHKEKEIYGCLFHLEVLHGGFFLMFVA